MQAKTLPIEGKLKQPADGSVPKVTATIIVFVSLEEIIQNSRPGGNTKTVIKL